jgi:hypothetical protein
VDVCAERVYNLISTGAWEVGYFPDSSKYTVWLEAHTKFRRNLDVSGLTCRCVCPERVCNFS